MRDEDKQLLAELSAPFDPAKIHWRVGATTQDKSKGIALAYINARDVMRRLDDVMGLDWQCRYPFDGCCEIGLFIGGEWRWRSNGAGDTAVEADKGRYSDAFKRAAVMWDVGRYLYDLENTWVPIKPAGRSYVIAQPPQLPQWAIPGEKATNITESQALNIESLLDEVGADKAAFLAHIKKQSIADIPANQYDAIVALIEKKRSA